MPLKRSTEKKAPTPPARRDNSLSWFARARKVIPGGVNSPVRAFGFVGGDPPFIEQGAGSRIFDADQNEYLDYVCSWGALILGHAHPKVVQAATEAIGKGSSFGAATAGEVKLAELVRTAIPSIELLRLVNSGTEATMTAVRLARAFTNRSKVLKFEGCYHGHADPFLVKAGSGLLTFGNPSSQGIPQRVLQETLVASYNSIEALKQAFASYGRELACVIVEPVAGNMGVVAPEPGFLETLRSLCNESKTLLIFDEVITGFRFHFGGYQSICKIDPDLTCLGKIMGGGFPLAAVGGNKEIMSLLAPLGPVYQAGTLSGNPVSTAAGLATLEVLQKENPYPEIEKRAVQLAGGIKKNADQAGIPLTVNRIGSMLSFFFNPGPVSTFEAVMVSDRERYKRLFLELLKRGIYLPPSPFEALFVSAAHSQEDLAQTVDAIQEAVLAISKP